MTGSPPRYSATPAAVQGLPYLGADDVAAVPMVAAADALTAAISAGLDIAAAPPRAVVDVRAGQLLLMPGEIRDFVGVKVASVAPANPDRGLPRIQGTFLLMDADTLAPVALMDGVALTSLRTPAVSAAAVRHLAATSPARLVVFGAGPQAVGHCVALHRTIGLTEISVITRHPARAVACAVGLAADLGVQAKAGDLRDLAEADVVVCATTARHPLFPASAVRRGTVVVAVGSHEPDAAELPPDLLARAQVVVEDPATALREAGDVIQAVASSALRPADLVPFGDIVTGARQADPARTRVFKSVGMAWEDVVVAATVHAGWLGRREGAEGDG